MDSSGGEILVEMWNTSIYEYDLRLATLPQLGVEFPTQDPR
jgi:hypothetical protein